MGRNAARARPVGSSDAGFTLVENAVAAVLVVTFVLGVAATMSAAFGASRGNILRQQATTVLNEELEYVRALSWDEVGMSAVDATAPMLNDTATLLIGTEAGFAGTEVLAVFTDTGVIGPRLDVVVDGQTYTMWRYVSHTDAAMRRVVVLLEWEEDGAAEDLLGSTILSEVSARINGGGVTTTTTTTVASS